MSRFFSGLEEQKEFLKARPEPFPEFACLRELVRPLAPPNAELPPGARFGPLVGTAFGELPAFAWIIEAGRRLELEGLTFRELPTR